MIQTATRRVIYLGTESEMPAHLARILVSRGIARYAEPAAAPETATATPPERAMKPLPEAKIGRRPRSKSSKVSP